jgi:hypothetical protein
MREEEDLSFSSPFFLQSANNPNPKRQKQPKPQTSKCNCNPSSSITQKKLCTHHPSNNQLSEQILHHLTSKFFTFNYFSHFINTQKTNISIKPIKKIIAHIPLKLNSRNSHMLENSKTKKAV